MLKRVEAVSMMSFATWFAVGIGVAVAIGLLRNPSKNKKGKCYT
jgi:hypothetical protein